MKGIDFTGKCTISINVQKLAWSKNGSDFGNQKLISHESINKALFNGVHVSALPQEADKFSTCPVNQSVSEWCTLPLLCSGARYTRGTPDNVQRSHLCSCSLSYSLPLYSILCSTLLTYHSLISSASVHRGDGATLSVVS